jgi:hypothetical protein
MRNTPSTLQTRLPLSLACAAALALPAYALTNESFRPIEHRIHLEGRDASSSFELASQESLFFELEVIVRAPTDARGGIAISLNDTEVAKLQVERLYVMQRARLLVPLDAVRKGENRLRANVGETPSATFDMTLRVPQLLRHQPAVAARVRCVGRGGRALLSPTAVDPPCSVVRHVLCGESDRGLGDCAGL